MKRKAFFLACCILISSVFSVCVSASPNISAVSAIVINGNTGTVLYSKNSDRRMPMASTTKIMSALLLCEMGNLDKTLTVTDEMVNVEGSSMGLRAGYEVTRRDLLYGMLLASGNDAANAAAISLGGSTEKFVGLMNEKAKSLGLKNTSFETPSGLDGDNHYTTAYDLAVITMNALANSDFREACSSYKKTVYIGNPAVSYTLVNHNRLLKSYKGMVGVKTGFTKKSGRCLVTAAERDGALIIAVTLNDPDDWNDHENLLDYGFSVLNRFDVSAQFDDIVLPVVGSDGNAVRIVGSNFSLPLTSDEARRVERKITAPAFLYSPVIYGMSVGTAEYYLDGKLLGTSELTVFGEARSDMSSFTFLQKFYINLIWLIKGL